MFHCQLTSDSGVGGVYKISVIPIILTSRSSASGRCASETEARLPDKENTMTQDLREIVDEATLKEARQAEIAVIYKHSTRCPISLSAKREVDRFVEQTPGVPVYVLNVVQNQTLSRLVAQELRVRHESPQAILIRSGEAKKHASHRQITVQQLEAWVTEGSG